ncbi:thiamine phosphate phosphatase-like protein [Zingiber officinale]|uniref:Uncharacterized protein n=1 Tax=Zingiber officinale TaxID=94328 RepID=A0A8J5LQH9_ZINOF|nr:thiamine phosphate phosphatase-like protein [Zingiber officinale]KAG6529865.1 hypothetical protein ZIOFF_012080 [Zingiber officinale]
MASATVVVVFDFDKTIIDCDSDDWVVNQLGLRDVFELLLPTMQWNLLMGRMMSVLHSRGKSIEAIAECLRRAPVDPHVIEAIKTAYSLGCELRVVSDANLFFIETILKHHGLLECFSEINTNPSYVDEEGRLRILPCHDFIISSHGCSLCPANMCKGKIIDRIQSTSSTEGKKRFIYLGDGKGDYCPSLKLNQGDFVMPRKNYPLWNLILGNRQLLKAEVHEWSNGEELKLILLQLINRAIDGGNYRTPTQVLSVDCKHVPVAVSGAEDRPIPLRIPQ